MSNNLSEWIDVFKRWMDAHVEYRLHWENKVKKMTGYHPLSHVNANLLFACSQPSCFEHPNLLLVLDILDIMERNDPEGDLLRCAQQKKRSFANGDYPAGRIESLKATELEPFNTYGAPDITAASLRHPKYLKRLVLLDQFIVVWNYQLCKYPFQRVVTGITRIIASCCERPRCNFGVVCCEGDCGRTSCDGLMTCGECGQCRWSQSLHQAVQQRYLREKSAPIQAALISLYCSDSSIPTGIVNNIVALMTSRSLPSITPGAYEGDAGEERDYYDDIIHFK